MPNLLIIRSAGFQQLDMNLPEIAKAFPEHTIHILTHEHGVKLAVKYQEVKRIHIYPYNGSFDFRRTVSTLEKIDFDVVIVLVTNLTGAGFFNVLLYSMSVKANKRFVCNMVSKMWEFTGTDLFRAGAKNVVASVVAGVGTILLSVIMVPFLWVNLKRLEK